MDTSEEMDLVIEQIMKKSEKLGFSVDKDVMLLGLLMQEFDRLNELTQPREIVEARDVLNIHKFTYLVGDCGADGISCLVKVFYQNVFVDEISITPIYEDIGICELDVLYIILKWIGVYIVSKDVGDDDFYDFGDELFNIGENRARIKRMNMSETRLANLFGLAKQMQ